jgi:hypothetical protein
MQQAPAPMTLGNVRANRAPEAGQIYLKFVAYTCSECIYVQRAEIKLNSRHVGSALEWRSKAVSIKLIEKIFCTNNPVRGPSIFDAGTYRKSSLGIRERGGAAIGAPARVCVQASVLEVSESNAARRVKQPIGCSNPSHTLLGQCDPGGHSLREIETRYCRCRAAAAGCRKNKNFCTNGRSGSSSRIRAADA